MENAHLKVFVMIQLEFVSVMQDLKDLCVKVKANFYHLTITFTVKLLKDDSQYLAIKNFQLNSLQIHFNVAASFCNFL
jgi:hypothetical protein